MEFWTYYGILKRWRWLIAATTLAALAVGLLLNPERKNDFEATATLSIPSETRALFMVSGLPADTGAMRDASAFNLLRSRELASRVVRRFGFDLRPNELQRQMSIVKEQGTDLIRVTVAGRTPAEAIALTNAVAETAAAYDQEAQSRSGTMAREFVEKQVDDARAELRKAEDALLAYKQTHEAELAAPQGAQFGSLRNESQRIGFALSQVDAKLAQVRGQMGLQSATRTDQEIADNPIAQQLRGDLVGLEVALTSELALHTEKYPSVVALKAKIEAVRDRLSSELKKTVSRERTEFNPVYDALVQNRINLETEKVALLAEKEAIDRATFEARGDLPSVDKAQMEQSRLSRSVDILGKEYVNLQDRLQQARLKEQELQDLGSLSVESPAASAVPASPLGRIYRLMFAAILGLMGGAALGLALEYVDSNTLRSPATAERLLGLPVLAAIPRSRPDFEEAYQLLRVNVGTRESKRKPDVIAVMSPTPHEGASTVVAGLARALARTGRQTIVVDASLHRPAQHALFGVSNERGLTDVLAGDATLDEALVRTDRPNLLVLPSGPTAGDSIGLLGHGRVADLFAELRQRADVILVDAVPAIFADASAVASLASRLTLVMDARKGRRGLDEALKSQIESIGTRVIGVVLTHVKSDRVPSYVHQARLSDEPVERGLSPAAAMTMLLIVGLLAAIASVFIFGTPQDRGAAVELFRSAAQWTATRVHGVGL